MQVTLISLNPPKVREVNPYGEKPEVRFDVKDFFLAYGDIKKHEYDLDLWQQAESSLKEWELSEESYNKFKWRYSDINVSYSDWAIGQVLNVEIVEGKAVII
jgi:hypothetical protein